MSIKNRFPVINLICILIILIIFAINQSNKNEYLSIHFISVDYADAILIKYPEHANILIDAGSKESAPHLLSYLRNEEVIPIDMGIITHPHKNHFEGFLPLAESKRVKHFLINGDTRAEEGYAELLGLIRSQNVPVKIGLKGTSVSQLPGDLDLTVLHPQHFNQGVNASSMVLLLEYKDVSVLFTADIQPEQQQELLREYPQIKKAKVVQIPHHGGPISGEFANAFKEAVLVMSTGKNKWGIPGEEDLAKIKNRFFRTDQDGDIVFKTDGKSIWISKGGHE